MRILLVAATICLIPPARARSQSAEARAAERSLAWVDDADPAAMFADSSRAGHAHFLAVCGYACVTPGVGSLTYAHCYRRSASVVTIDRTGDVIESDRHAALKRKAAELAERYNALTVAALDARGRRDCPAAERWDEYWRALNAVADAIPARPYRSFVLVVEDRAFATSDFQLHVQEERHLIPALRERTCALAPRFGIARRVRFVVTSGNINDHPKAHAPFTCLGGAVAD